MGFIWTIPAMKIGKTSLFTLGLKRLSEKMQFNYASSYIYF